MPYKLSVYHALLPGPIPIFLEGVGRPPRVPAGKSEVRVTAALFSPVGEELRAVRGFSLRDSSLPVQGWSLKVSAFAAPPFKIFLKTFPHPHVQHKSRTAMGLPGDPRILGLFHLLVILHRAPQHPEEGCSGGTSLS